MALRNISKPSSSLTNTSKVLNYETFDSNTTTFDTETRTFDEMATSMSNTSKPSGTLTNIAKP